VGVAFGAGEWESGEDDAEWVDGVTRASIFLVWFSLAFSGGQMVRGDIGKGGWVGVVGGEIFGGGIGIGVLGVLGVSGVSGVVVVEIVED